MLPGWIQAFIVVAALAIVIQTAILLSMFVQIKVTLNHFQKLATDLHTRFDPILVRTTRIIEESEDRIRSITTDTAEITRLARSQAQKLDRVVTDTLERVRIQVLRADQMITGTLEVIEEAGTTVRAKVWKPVMQISALIKGIKAGLDVLRGGPGPDGEVAHQDEELFI
jgi:hypothetical protein